MKNHISNTAALTFSLLSGLIFGIVLITFAIAKRRNRSYLGFSIQLPANRVIDKYLVLGSMTFGIGWELAGICPAPAFVLLDAGSDKGIIFVIAMVTGMGLYELLESFGKTDNKHN